MRACLNRRAAVYLVLKPFSGCSACQTLTIKQLREKEVKPSAEGERLCVRARVCVSLDQSGIDRMLLTYEYDDWASWYP